MRHNGSSSENPIGTVRGEICDYAGHVVSNARTPRYLLGVKESAEALCVSEWTIRYLLRTGQLARTRIGTRVLISTAELERFITARTESVQIEPNPKRQLGDRVAELVDRTGR